jgi:hypothetical protein
MPATCRSTIDALETRSRRIRAAGGDEQLLPYNPPADDNPVARLLAVHRTRTFVADETVYRRRTY